MSSAHEERRLITILFADLSGFTGLSSKLDPEEVREAVNLCFEHLNKAIVSQGGTVHKYEGDLVMALFGLPFAHEDDPERALQASFEMLRMLPEINRALSSRIGNPTDLGLHVGINSGTVVVGEIGSPEKREFTVMGDPVNLASRLKDLANRGEIMVSESVFRASRYLFEYEAREPVAMKGIEEPVRVFRPVSRKEKPDPKRGIQGLSSPLVAREKELGELLGAVGRLQQGQEGAVFVFGDAGLGKTRLLDELKKWITDHKTPMQILEGHCLTYGENIPYWPFLQVLGTVFGITDKDSRERVRDKVVERSQTLLLTDWKEVAPYLGYLFSIRFEGELDEKVKYLDAQVLKSQILVSVRKLLAALSRTLPMLLVIEDYHWIDAESLELLEFLFESPEPFPMLLLVLSRPEKEEVGYKVKERLKRALGKDIVEITLGPLSPSAGTQLVHNLLQMSGFPGEFKDRILAKAGGNPFFLEEIIRSLIDSGILTYREGSWLLNADPGSFSIPDTVQALIASRLDKLEKDAREVLQIAAVIGRNFNVPVLERLSGVNGLMLSLYLVELEEHEYISERRGGADRECFFRHPLVHEVAYNGLLKRRRRELHRRAGEAIEGLCSDRLEDFTELLAYQYAQGDNHRKALEWLRKAGQKAKDRYANDEAIGYFKQALSLLETDGEGRADDLCSVYEALGDIHRLKGEYEMAPNCYHSVVRHAGEDTVRQANARRKIAEVYYLQGSYDEALKVLDEAEGILTGDTPEERIGKAEIHRMRCNIYGKTGENEEAKKAAEMSLGFLDAAGRGNALPGEDPRIPRVRAGVWNSLGSAVINTGAIDEGRDLFQKSLTLGEELEFKPGILAGFNNLGMVCRMKGDLQQAIDLYKKSLAMAEEIGDRYSLVKTCTNIGLLYVQLGEFDKAKELYERVLIDSREIGDKLGICQTHRRMGFLFLELGEFERAKALLLKSLEEAEEISSKRLVAMSSYALGELFSITGELEEAERFLLKSEDLSRETGEKLQLVVTYNTLAKLKIKYPEPTASHLQEALGYAEKAFRLATEVGSPTYQAGNYFAYGAIHASAGDFRRSEECFQKAIVILEGLREKKLLADCYLEYARMLKKAGAETASLQGRAEDCFAKARDLYGEMKLTYKVQECL